MGLRCDCDMCNDRFDSAGSPRKNIKGVGNNMHIKIDNDVIAVALLALIGASVGAYNASDIRMYLDRIMESRIGYEE